VFHLDERPAGDSANRTHGGRPCAVVELGNYFSTKGSGSTKLTIFMPERPLLRIDDDGFLVCGREKSTKIGRTAMEHVDFVAFAWPGRYHDHMWRCPSDYLNQIIVFVCSHQLSRSSLPPQATSPTSPGTCGKKDS
jgi:hypothetical protein|tara:strand:- start:19 stop:426 length:408 start_codon:yes stop_codon:yes gene_type:complete